MLRAIKELLWPSPPNPEGLPENQYLAELLDRVADDIAQADDDPVNVRWSLQVRASAAQVRAGQRAGVEGFLRLADPDPRNTFNEQPFTRTRMYSEAIALAGSLASEFSREELAAREAPPREVVLRPWTAGSPGKAVVYADGTVLTSEDDAEGNPGFDDIADGGQRRSPVALVVIAADGSCDAQHLLREREWLAAKLHAHDSRLQLTQQRESGSQAP